jgi:transposase
MPKGTKYSAEFRAQACRQVLEFSRPIRQVAADLGINSDTLRVWLKRARDKGVEMADNDDSDHDAEVRRLRAELKQRDDGLYWKDQEIEFLKQAAGFFAAEHRPKRGSK